jgi:hypothetical protein
VISWNAKYPIFRNAGCGADGVEKAYCQFVLIAFTRERHITRGQDEVGGIVLSALPSDSVTHGS